MVEIANIISEIEGIVTNSANNSTEPLAAHTIAPLMLEMAKIISLNDTLTTPQSLNISFSLVTEIVELLKEMAFEHLIEADPNEPITEEHELHTRSRVIFLALDSEIKRLPLEAVSQQWKVWLEQQRAIYLTENENENEDEDEDEGNESNAADSTKAIAEQNAIETEVVTQPGN